MKKVLSISGGGSLGAWGSGLTKRILDSGQTYHTYIGASTGSLIMSIAAQYQSEITNNFDIYQNVENKDIWRTPPFTEKNAINLFSIILRIIRGKSIGDMSNLKKLIYRHFLESDYEEIRESNIEMVVVVTSLEDGKTYYYSSYDISYRDYVQLVYASCSPPVISDPVKWNDVYYIDGGISDHIPLEYKSLPNDSLIDVIVHRPSLYPYKPKSVNNVFNQAIMSLDIMRKEITENDVKSSAINGKIKNIYFLPEKYWDINPMKFEKSQMKDMFYDAYNSIDFKKSL